MDKFVDFFTSNALIALSTFIGILSFAISIYSALKTHKINKTLDRFKTRQIFAKKQDEILLQIDDVIKELLTYKSYDYQIPLIVFLLSTIQNSYGSILDHSLKVRIKKLLRYLKKPYGEMERNYLLYELGYVKGALEKKEIAFTENEKEIC